SACPRPERRRRPHRVRPDPKRRRRRTPAAATRARPPLRREHEPSSGLLRTAALNSTRLPAGLETPTFRRGPRVLGRLHRHPRFAGDNEEVPEETPEQVMARLARYADSLRRAPGGPIDPARRRFPGGTTRTLPPRSALQSKAPPAPSSWGSMPAAPSPWSRPPVAPVPGVTGPTLAYPQHP